jgi:1-acyl-sn-glycerol-3-phosphate acyltransferase
MPGASFLAVWRFFLIMGVYLTHTPIYWMLLKLHTATGRRFGRYYLSNWRKCIGHQIVIKGKLSSAKPTLFVANHSSYVDILILGTCIPGRFVAKQEVAKWPVMGWLATQQGTIYIERKREAIADGTESLVGPLEKGENLILFPEGTTSDGCRVLPFKSSFFDVAMKKNLVVQPVSVAYVGWDRFSMPRFLRKQCGWFSEEVDLLTHLWELAQLGTIQVIVELHPPLKAKDFSSRKALAAASFQAVQGGLIKAFASPLSTQMESLCH